MKRFLLNYITSIESPTLLHNNSSQSLWMTYVRVERYFISYFFICMINNILWINVQLLFVICYILIKILLCICFLTHLGALFVVCEKRFRSFGSAWVLFILSLFNQQNKTKFFFVYFILLLYIFVHILFLLSTNAARKYKGDKVLPKSPLPRRLKC